MADKSPKSLKNSPEDPKDIQIGAFVRGLENKGIVDFKEKARLTCEVIRGQNTEGIFPYDRYLKTGSDTSSDIISPGENIERNCIVWCNNHYLGLNKHPDMISAAVNATKEYGTGCGTSAASGGFNSLHKALEKEISRFTGKEEAVLYPTGFTANLGAIGTMAKKGDMILVDRESHASMIDGIIMSGADYCPFKHNALGSLEKLLKKAESKKYNNVFVLTESVFSMSGEEAPLADYCALKNKYRFFLYVDEAHAFGFYGEKGAGLGEALSCTNNIDFLMSTLSKATASIGGFVGTDKCSASYLRINSDPYLFQACLTPADAAANIAALKIIRSDRDRRKRLWDNTNYFRENLIKLGFDTGSSKSPIVPLYIKEENKLSLMCRDLFRDGIFTNWISYPAVQKGTGRLRFIVTANHTKGQFDETLDKLSVSGRKLGII